MLYKLLLVSITLLLLTRSKTYKKCATFSTELECINNDECEWQISKKNSRCKWIALQPKNLILMIADGLGPNYNAAFRLFKGLDETILDQYLVGTFSTRAINQTIIDSAASATALNGLLTKNTQIGTDINMNPISNIFEAAKEKGKGIGVITNTRVTHATPAAFTSHVAQRTFEDLIAMQQGSRISGDVDILFGGGLIYFDGSRNGNTCNLIEDYLDYGWNSLSLNKTDLSLLDKDDLPSIGLFTSSSFPDYLQRKYNSEYYDIPSLLDMTKKAIELLSANYGDIDDDGFMLMIESGQVDWGGHANDLPYLLNEMDEYHHTLDYVINEFVANREFDDTLVVILADHETGGLVLGRESNWNKTKLIDGPTGPEIPDKDTKQSQTNNIFDYDPLVVPSLIDELGNTHMYEFFVEPALYPTRTAWSVALMINALVIINNDFTELFDIIETYYIEQLTQQERNFIISCYNRLNDENILINHCLTKIISIRMNAGWTTLGHSGSDIQISSTGPYSDKFRGFNGNVQNIGNKLIDIFDLKDEIEIINQKLKDLFLSDDLILCDNDVFLNYIDTILWPEGNYKYPGLCFEF